MEKEDMQQEGAMRKTPASFNPNPRWPQGYFEVLAEAGIPARQHSFYAHWVRQFFNRNPGEVALGDLSVLDVAAVRSQQNVGGAEGGASRRAGGTPAVRVRVSAGSGRVRQVRGQPAHCVISCFRQTYAIGMAKFRALLLIPTSKFLSVDGVRVPIILVSKTFMTGLKQVKHRATEM